jgi:hypothetical protein
VNVQLLRNLWSTRQSQHGLLILPLMLIFAFSNAFGQVDQGTITGTVQDQTGAVLPQISVSVTSTDTGLTLKTTTDESGIYTFSPIKIGNYTVTAVAPGFQKSTLSGIVLNLNQRLQADLTLQPGDVTSTVTVQAGAEQLMQTDDSSSGQVISSKVINDTPLSGRNYVFVAQLSAGVAQSNGSRGQGNGDFSANGLRAEQNNFILDGVDNNSNLMDFLNGATYVVKPPPDALAEFKVQTSNYTAELGHSAGAVLNASIKSGTNSLHGNLWEYLRNDALDARDFFALTKPEYRQNQFGGTIGGPILKDKLFFFGDMEADRIVFGNTGTYTVPTDLMRQGNFSELLNTSLTGASQPTYLYQPGTKGSALLACNGQNVFCASQIDTIAQRILNLYPTPNANGGKTYNNYITNTNDTNNSVSWDGRIDWNASARDQAFFRMSYSNLRGSYPAPFGPILDGGGYGSDGPTVNMGQNYVLSETHIFNPTLINEFRFGYNWEHAQFLQQSANTDVAAQVGLGGIPYSANNGGLPSTSISGISGFGSPGYYPSIETENVYQILDNVTKILGNHTLKMGASLQSIRVAVTQPINPHGSYSFDGFYTSNPETSFTGFGVADFLADSMNYAGLSNFFGLQDDHWYSSGYFQDDWKALPGLTFNLGLRYDFYQPAYEQNDHQAYFTINAINGPGSGTATYLMPNSTRNIALANSFLSDIEANNIGLSYSGNRSLVLSQKTNFSPRVGFAYQLNSKLVVRGGYGMFFGGLESAGGAPNPSYNYPFAFSSNFPSAGCSTTTNYCPTNGLTLETGYSAAIAAGLQNYLSTPGLAGGQLQTKTPYTEQFNFSTQYAITPTLSLTSAYVGNVSRHLQAITDQNAPVGLVGPQDNSQLIRPFSNFGGAQYSLWEGAGSYNSLQETLEKHVSNGLYFLAAYTYGHALDDTATPLDGGTNNYRNANLFPIGIEMTNSDWDVRHRFTLSADYALPFGKGREFLNGSGLLNRVVGGWSTDLAFYAMTGNPFTVSPNNSGANGANTRRAILVKDAYAAGGAPDASNSSTSCAVSTRNTTNWFNPCAFANPLPGSLIPNTQTPTNPLGTPITNPVQALAYLGTARNQIYGPGYERINLSLFKNFDTFESQYLQFRVDTFNAFNTPAFGQPNGSDNTNGGQIPWVISLRTLASSRSH